MSGVFWWVGRLKNGEELLEFSSCPGGQPCEMKNCPKGQWHPVEELCSTACCWLYEMGSVRRQRKEHQQEEWVGSKMAERVCVQICQQ